ncbi:MAG TPA: hypothetical protein VD860_08615 [Azospirillum sp.]|nr:hypothetical protein [Azospirillum sp.]
MTTTADQSPTIARDAALLARWRAGERRTLDRLLQHYEPFIQQRVSAGARSASRTVREDVAQEARIALMQCAQRWDPAHGVGLMSYAQAEVDRACWLASATQGDDPLLPASVVRNTLPAVARTARAVSAERPDLDSDGVAAEVAVRLGLRRALVDRLLVISARAPAVELDAPAGDGDGGTLADGLHDQAAPDPDEGILRAQQRRYLRAAVDSLSDRERALLHARLYQRPHSPPSLRELAPEFGCRFQSLARVEAKAVERVSRIIRRRCGLPSENFASP